MRKLVAGFLFLTFIAAAFPTYAKRSDDVKVKINKQVKAKGLTIEFVELVEDSRCPVDVQCVWAGNAKIKVRVTKNGESKIITLELVTRGLRPNYGDHLLKLKGLSPELRSDVRINRNEYVATIEVKKVR